MTNFAVALGRKLEARFRLLTFAGTLMPTVAALLVQLVAFAVTARGLGVEQFGAYTALLAVAVVSVELVGLGGADLLVRGIVHSAERFSEYFGNLLILVGMTLPVVVIAGAWVALHLIGTRLDALHVFAVILGEVLVGRAAASLEIVMVAFRHTVRAGVVRLLTATLRLCLAAGFFLAAGLHDLDRWIEAAFVQSVLTALAYCLLAVHLYGRPRAALLRREMRTGVAFCLIQVSRSAQGNIDRMVLSRFADDASVGIYGAASRLLALGMFPIQVVTRITYPNFYVHGRNGIRASRAYALKIAPILFAVGAAGSLAVAAAGYLAPYVLGPDFAEMAGIAAKLGIALPLIALQYPPSDALTGAGRQKVRTALSVCATVGFGFVLALGSRYGGIDGLIVAFIASHAVLAAATWAAAFLHSDH